MSTLPPPPAQQPESAAPPQYAPQQFPPPGAPGPKSKTNGLGIASIIVGSLGLVMAIIPLIGAFGGFLAFVGLVLGVIGLFLKNKAKLTAIIGSAISGLALILAIIFGVIYTAAFVQGFEDATNNDGTVTVPDEGEEAPAEEAPAKEEAPAADLGTRDNPAPIGSTVTLNVMGTPTWEVSIGAPSWDVTADVKAANQFNPDPTAGNQYASFPATVKYIGTDTGTPQFDLTFDYVSAEGQVYTGAFVVADGQLRDVTELYPDATGTGSVIIELPTAAAGSGTWTVETVFGDPIHFAAQ